MADEAGSEVSRIVVLGTGGTIAGMASAMDDNVGYVAAQLGIEDVLRGVVAPKGFDLVAEQVAQIDSKDMDAATWQSIAVRCAVWLAEPDVAGIVITHGTDTLEETAFLLQCVLAPAKPIVLTCAMRPSTALVPDGPQNLLDAIAVAASKGARGVCAVCAGTVHGAGDVRKVHTYRLDAFGSGDAGALGHVEEGVLCRLRDWPMTDATLAKRRFDHVACTPPSLWPRVEIVTSHAGAGGRVVDALVRDDIPDDAGGRLRGLVIATTGNGTVHRDLETAAMRAHDCGVAVRRATRCANGRIVEARESDAVRPAHGASDALRSAGALTPVKARIALMLELMVGDGEA